MAKTFAQVLIENVLPKDIPVTRPMTKAETMRILKEVHSKHPEKYSVVVSDLKRLGDTLSTYESITIGMDEISVPNKERRDGIISTFKARFDKEKNPEKRSQLLVGVQDAVAENDLHNTKDDASVMVNSGAMAGKRTQLMKLRSSPVVMKDHNGKLVEDMVDRSYAQGFKPVDYWHGSAEARANLVAGQVATSEPGVINKITHNLMNTQVVSMPDCKTTHGITLLTRDDDALNRFLVQKAGSFKAGTLVTADVQSQLLQERVEEVLVRSPQTCAAPNDTVCAKCMGLSIGLGKLHTVGTNVGTISAGALSEVSTQLVLSAKHSTTMAKVETRLTGIKGLNTVTGMPKIYPNKQTICEVYGEVLRIRMAPQGGRYIWIRETQKVPERFILNAKPVKNMVRHWEYYIPPNRKVLEDIKEKTKVFPGMALTDGNTNLQDVARLRGLGIARSEAAQQISQVYKDTGHSLDRRHFELLSRAMMNYVKIEEAPSGLPFKRGEVVQYNKLREIEKLLKKQKTPLDAALGQTLGEEVAGMLIGTTITPQVQTELKKAGLKTVQVAVGLETSPMVSSMVRTQLMDDDNFIGKLNHRYLQNTLKDAAQFGQTQNLHTYSPIVAYAYGTELSAGKDGKY